MASQCEACDRIPLLFAHLHQAVRIAVSGFDIYVRAESIKKKNKGNYIKQEKENENEETSASLLLTILSRSLHMSSVFCFTCVKE